ncbi:MAG TPA: serine/threonine-protein kinase, partial [Isosphaeraceae bacterium]|nr:serine/threonine-protein kinase [Isosphaeraceae bacterium]
MSSHRHDRNLLFGILALQMNLISRDELLAATNEWITSSRRSLGEILKARRALGEEECSLLEGAVARHVELHGGDIGGSLAGFLSIARATVATRARSQTARDGIVAAGEAPASIARDEAGRGAAEGTTQRYQVLWPHARGGLGEVYVAEDGELHRRVALKEIQPRYAGDPVSRERFVVEAEITGNLEHPGIVPVYGLGWRPDGRPYYAMRFINGEELSKAIRRFHAGDAPDFQGLEFRWLLRRFIDVCNTIAYAHSRGVLHRDIKPGNIMLGPFGETLVMDWGVAKPVGRSEPATGGQAPSAPSDEPTIRPYSGGGGATLRGQAVGTPSYMSPEQAAGELDAMGPASDVYSLGATLYVLLANRPPFAGEPAEVLEDVQRGRFVAPRAIQPRVPRVLEAICRKAMAVQPARRYSSALALADDLERWLADEPVSAWREPWTARLRRWVRRHQPIVAGAAAAVIVAIAALGLAVPVLSIAWRNEAEARRAEAGQRIHAMQKAQEAEKALSFLVQAFRKPDPEVDGRSLKVVDLLDRAVAELDRALSDQPRMQATLWTAIGKTYSGLGMPREAIEVFQRALDRRRGLLGEDHPETLDSD